MTDIANVQVFSDHHLPVGEAGETVTVTVLSGDTVYYGYRQCSAAHNDGSLTVGQSTTVTAGGGWVVRAAKFGGSALRGSSSSGVGWRCGRVCCWWRHGKQSAGYRRLVEGRGWSTDECGGKRQFAPLHRRRTPRHRRGWVHAKRHGPSEHHHDLWPICPRRASPRNVLLCQQHHAAKSGASDAVRTEQSYDDAEVGHGSRRGHLCDYRRQPQWGRLLSSH